MRRFLLTLLWAVIAYVSLGVAVFYVFLGGFWLSVLGGPWHVNVYDLGWVTAILIATRALLNSGNTMSRCYYAYRPDRTRALRCP